MSTIEQRIEGVVDSILSDYALGRDTPGLITMSGAVSV